MNIKNKNDRLVYFFSALAIILILAVFDFLVNIKIDEMIDRKHNNIANDMQNQSKIMIDEKRNATLTIAMALAEDSQIKKALIDDDFKNIDLYKFSLKLRKNSDFKNVWFQIVSKDGVSKYRSWTKKRGDSVVNARIDVSKMIKEPKIMSTISTGKFDMTFKSMVPVFKNERFIGIIETITHFNSIYKNLLKKDIESVFLVDKKYKQQLIKPFTKMFIDDYYVANINAKKKFMDFIASQTVEHFIKFEKNYHIQKEFGCLITIYKQPDIIGKDMGYFILFKDLNHIDMSDIKNTKIILRVLGIAVLIIIMIFIYYITGRKYLNQITYKNKSLKEKINEIRIERNKTESILKALPNIVILTSGEEINDVNDAFFKFFDKYKNIEEFKKEHACVCDFFEDIKEDGYITGDTVEGLNWIKYIIAHSEQSLKVCMKKDQIPCYFIVEAVPTDFVKNNKKLTVVSFTDISYEVELVQSMQKKDKMLFQQTKMAAMGEMLGNIAHQWRQPLSVISTVATGLKMKIEHDMADKDEMIQDLDFQNQIAQHLSQTIDDFRNFFKYDKKKVEFDISKVLKKDIELISISLKGNNIEIISDCDNEINVYNYENEFMQAVLNILNNAKDSLISSDCEKKLIFVKCAQKDKNAVISIKDNGGGIDEEIIDKIFEPYFTTKHKAQGTGIGLFMTKQIIEDHMNGKIEAKNVSYEYEGEIFNGAEFTVSVNI